MLKLKEASERIGVNTAYLRRLIQQGRVDAMRNRDPKGPYWTISEEEVQRLVDERLSRKSRNGKSLAEAP